MVVECLALCDIKKVCLFVIGYLRFNYLVVGGNLITTPKQQNQVLLRPSSHVWYSFAYYKIKFQVL